MDPTQEQLQRREIDAGVIPVTDLTQNETPLEVPPAPPPTDFGGAIEGNLNALLESFNAPTAEETNANDLQGRILGSLERLGGESGRRQELEQEAGLPGQRTELQNVINQLQTLSKERQAIPLQVQEESVGRGRTAGGVAPIEASRLRKNAIEALSLSAIGQTLQGNIALAQQNIDRAIEAEFEPERTRLQTLQQLYAFNRDALQRVDKKRAQELEIRLGERERLLADRRVDRKLTYDVMTQAAQFGAPQDVVRQIQSASSPEEAIALAGPYMQDPQAKQALENAKLNAQLTKVRIERERQELNIFQKYGGLTPTQYLAKQKQEQQEMIEQGLVNDQAEAEARQIGQSLTQVDAILNSKALDSVVGPNMFARSIARQKEGFFGKAIGFAGGILSLGGTTGVVDEVTGRADDTVALTQQILDQQFLDKLINVKSQGATFGALSDNEGQALRNAANAIANSAIKKDERVVGYDMSEKEFRNQLQFIRGTMQKAHERATGETFSRDEMAIFESLEDTDVFNPTF